MTILHVIAILLVAIAISHLRDYILLVRIINFQKRAEDFISMHNRVWHSLEEGCISITYDGIFYTMNVNNLDYKSFTSQIELAICDVLDAYDKIGDFLFGQMNDDLTFKINQLYRRIIEIQNSINIVKWQKGF